MRCGLHNERFANPIMRFVGQAKNATAIATATMHFNVDAVPAEVPAFLRTLIEIPGIAAWKQRERDFESQIKVNPLIEKYFNLQFGIERAMFAVMKYRSNTGGRMPDALAPGYPSLPYLYKFAAIIARVHQRLARPEREILSRRIFGALKDGVGLAPLAFEMTTVGHFMARGFDVEFSDLRDGGGFDFLVRRETAELEVECKSISVDLGHPVHLFRQYQLGPYILDAMRDAAKRGVVQIVVATLPDRLHGQRDFMQAVGSKIADALIRSESTDSSPPCSVTYREFAIGESPFSVQRYSDLSEDQIMEYCSRCLSDEVGHTIVRFQPKQSATVVVVRSQKRTDMLTGLYRTIKEAATNQLTGTRPGVICVQFRNLTSDQLREIAGYPLQSRKPNSLQLLSARFFSGDSRRHVHTLAYTAPGHFIQKQRQRIDHATMDMMRDTITSEDAKCYFFTNKRHPLVNHPLYQAFGP